MKKRVKKLAALLMAVSVLGGGVVAEASSARSAADYTFTDFEIPALTYTQVSNPRLKENSTSVYCYIKKADKSVSAQVWGCLVSSFKENLTINSNGATTSCVTLSIGTQYQIYNSVYEKGYKYAGLKLKSNHIMNSDKVSGAWSADSVNTSGMTVASK